MNKKYVAGKTLDAFFQKYKLSILILLSIPLLVCLYVVTVFLTNIWLLGILNVTVVTYLYLEHIKPANRRDVSNE